jgi:glycosyltransferase involved in cell wall biosynthesis
MFLPNMTGGGAERLALACIEDLIERGHEVDVVLVRAEGQLMPLLPPQARVINLEASRIVASVLPLVRYLRDRKPDSLLAQRLAGSRVVLMVSDHTILSRHVRTSLQRMLLRWTTRLFYPLADIRIACSRTAADDLACVSGIPREDFEVIYNPISPPAAITTTPEVERLWGESAPRIITVGTLKQEKNHALLLRAFAELRSRPNAKLMILGDGPLKTMLEQLAAELGIADRVLMPGFAGNPWPYLASADLFVLSSDYEGFGIALAEAMHVGLRVVSTDCMSGPTEILDQGRFGRLVTCGDVAALAHAMEQALADPADAERIRERADEIAGPSNLARYAELLTGPKIR